MEPVWKETHRWLPRPSTSFMLMMCLYNQYSINAFTITPFGDVNIAMATITYWEPDDSYPSRVNTAIRALPDAFRDRVGFNAQDYEYTAYLLGTI